jgi:hypothetical protein
VARSPEFRPGTVQPAGVIPTVVSPPTMSSQRTPSIAHPSRGPIAASRRPVATSRAKTSPASNRPLSSACGSAVGSRPTTVAARSMMAVSSTATSRLTHPVRRNAVHAGSAATAGNSSPSWPRRETSLRARAAAFAARCASRRPVECAATTPGVSGAKRSASEARSRRVRCPATRWRRPRSPAATARPATSSCRVRGSGLLDGRRRARAGPTAMPGRSSRGGRDGQGGRCRHTGGKACSGSTVTDIPQ